MLNHHAHSVRCDVPLAHKVSLLLIGDPRDHTGQNLEQTQIYSFPCRGSWHSVGVFRGDCSALESIP